MPMLDVLHEVVDAQEELRIKARLAVERLRPRLVDAVERTGDTTTALELIAALAEDALASITTEAVHTGADFAERRFEASKGS